MVDAECVDAGTASVTGAPEPRTMTAVRERARIRMIAQAIISVTGRRENGAFGDVGGSASGWVSGAVLMAGLSLNHNSRITHR